jgi:hypothetical protein
LNAEGAKIAQRTQKRKYQKIQKEDKNSTSKLILKIRIFYIKYFVFLLNSLVFFCALCETFAPSAFKKSPYFFCILNFGV